MNEQKPYIQNITTLPVIMRSSVLFDTFLDALAICASRRSVVLSTMKKVSY